MKKTALFMSRQTQDSEEVLTLDPTANPYTRKAKKKDKTLEGMAGVLDANAADLGVSNAVGLHMALGALLDKMIGRKGATKVFRRLVDMGGLHAMLGHTGRKVDDISEFLGVPIVTSEEEIKKFPVPQKNGRASRRHQKKNRTK